MPPPHVLPRSHALSDIHTIFWFIVIFFKPNGGHLRPRPRPSFFLMACVSTPQTREPAPARRAHLTPHILHGLIRSSYAKILVHSGCCNERGGKGATGSKVAQPLILFFVLCVCVVVSMYFWL